MPPDFIREFDVRASAERVWAVMSDVERWPAWTASVTSVTLDRPAPLALGAVALIKQPKFPVGRWVVTDLQPGREFSWTLTSPGVRCVARHAVTPTPAGSRVTLSLTYTGWLTGPLIWATRKLTDEYLDLEQAGLTRTAEQGTAA